MTLENTIDITAEELGPRVLKLKQDGFRIMAVTPLDFGGELELIYLFDRDLEIKGLRLRVPRDANLQSITPHYYAAFLIENEIQDLFNVKFENLVIDYKGHLFVQEEVRNLPYGQISIQKNNKEEKT
ncbi:MAG: NADH-quinone oxidoreductase subunit C [Desulfonatronovibrio sp.]